MALLQMWHCPRCGTCVTAPGVAPVALFRVWYCSRCAPVTLPQVWLCPGCGTSVAVPRCGTHGTAPGASLSQV